MIRIGDEMNDRIEQ